MKKRIFSGIQPSGNLHIGNYLGAIRNWAPLQEEYDCIYCVVDLHALTVYQKPEILHQKIYDTVATLLAAGIEPEKSIIFVQSQVKEHAELAWILNTITPIGELQRMTQFKEKVQRINDKLYAEFPSDFNKSTYQKGKPYEFIQIKTGSPNAGLLNYPVLMAADILLYNAEAVPVGEDQRQHVEIARVIARKFNNLYGQTFKEPNVIIKKEAARIMSLSDPSKKMSKSDSDALGCVDVSDTPDMIREKFKKAVTDSGKEIIYRPDKPAISNLLMIYSGFSGILIKDVENKFAGKSYNEFKGELAEIVIKGLEQFQKKYNEIKNNPDLVEKTIKEGSQKAKELAEPMMKEVRKKIGLD